MRPFDTVVCVIRTWSDNPDIEASVARALEAGLRAVIVVVKDEDARYRGAVETRLKARFASDDGRIAIVPMVSGYGWSSALNAGVQEVHRLNADERFLKAGTRIAYVLNVSNEAEYRPEHLQAMRTALESGAPSVSAVGTTFEGRHGNEAVPLGKMYQRPRNTLMLVRLAAYDVIGGYDVRCDALGGQEDWEWLARLEAAGQGWSLLDLKVPLRVGTPAFQAEKEAREAQAVARAAEAHEDVARRLKRMVEDAA